MTAEIREAEAPPEVAAIYARLREGYGLPLVNLIWRRFAALPGVLPWAWESVAPALPLLPAARDRVAASVQVPSLPVGVEASRLAALYNRGNLGNLIFLTALMRGKEGHAVAAPASPPGMLPEPPPLPRLDALDEDTARRVRALATLHGHEGGVVPTLYLHLANWPALLTPLYTALSPMMATGRIAALRDGVLVAASVEADRLRPYLAAPPEPPVHAMAEARELLRVFTGRVIPEMVPIGLMMAR
ncbi:hypothetical protein [Roseococcus sp. YIM B11640]|uniref:hypothetical protein n=1 Tax=Roseococcus sp. YIM B11640 TaxID=3133973 RepID=UPI003C7D7339